MRLRPLAFATFLVWRLRISACGFWRLWQLPGTNHDKRKDGKKLEMVHFRSSERDFFQMNLEWKNETGYWLHLNIKSGSLCVLNWNIESHLKMLQQGNAPCVIFEEPIVHWVKLEWARASFHSYSQMDLQTCKTMITSNNIHEMSRSVPYLQVYWTNLSQKAQDIFQTETVRITLCKVIVILNK